MFEHLNVKNMVEADPTTLTTCVGLSSVLTRVRELTVYSTKQKR